MSHHSSVPMGDSFRQQMEMEAQRLELGATRRTPSGTVHESDEGEIRMGVAHDPRAQKVFLNFGKPVTWLGMNPQEAFELGDLLIRHSFLVRGIDPDN